MKLLRKTLLAIGLIILLAVLKIIILRRSPSSSVFYFNLFSALQLLLILWAIITGLLETIIWNKDPPGRARRKSSAFFISLIALSEIACLFILHHPSLIHGTPDSPFVIYYNNYQRDILQFNRTLSRYDTALFYKMQSNNTGLFENIEFSDSIFTDQHGFRHDVTSVAKDKIICLGDSYTLGWGVRQQEAYPQQLESILKTPVLNTGMSSYGTAREIESIRQLDKTNTTTLVIQYCYNDADENRSYINNGYRLPVSPRSVYDQACEENKWSKVYFPGKCFCTLLKIFLNEKLNFLPEKILSSKVTAVPPINYDDNAFCFLEVLKRAGLDFSRIHLIVFDIGEYNTLNDRFAQALDRRLKIPENHDLFKDHVHVLHISHLLTPSDYYTLDEHIRPSGQRKLALALASVIGGLR